MSDNTHVTPVGELQFSHINYAKPYKEGEPPRYEAKILLTKEQAKADKEALSKKVVEYATESGLSVTLAEAKKAVRALYKEFYALDEEGEKTSEMLGVQLVARQRETVVTKTGEEIKFGKRHLYDAEGNLHPFDNQPKVGKGSKVRLIVKFQLRKDPTLKVTLRFEGLQIMELVEWESKGNGTKDYYHLLNDGNGEVDFNVEGSSLGY